MRKILVIGAAGQVGWELQRTLATLGAVTGVEGPACDRPGLLKCDLFDLAAVQQLVRQFQPAAIVNAAAYTAVDRAEAESELALRLNAGLPGMLAEEAKRLGIPFVTYSTDYVFDGSNAEPYTETSRPNPLNAYGRTKLAGDEAVAAAGGAYLIFRTQWVYGTRGSNFLLTVLRLARERAELRIVNDQFGAPTWCRAVAEATAQALSQSARCEDWGTALAEHSGLYNLSAAGEVTWHGFAAAILDILAQGGTRIPRLAAITSEQYQSAARRPGRSLLAPGKVREVFGIEMPGWRTSLEQVMEDLPGPPG